MWVSARWSGFGQPVMAKKELLFYDSLRRQGRLFRDAIYSLFGGLDAYPNGVAQRPLAHTNSWGVRLS